MNDIVVVQSTVYEAIARLEQEIRLAEEDLWLKRQTLRRLKSRYNYQTRKTHCPKGHEYTAENTRYYAAKNGSIWRRCRACHNGRTGNPRGRPRA
jgi:hypothetical protein